MGGLDSAKSATRKKSARLNSDEVSLGDVDAVSVRAYHNPRLGFDVGRNGWNVFVPSHCDKKQ